MKNSAYEILRGMLWQALDNLEKIPQSEKSLRTFQGGYARAAQHAILIISNENKEWGILKDTIRIEIPKS